MLSEIKTTLYRKPRDEFRRLHRWGPRAYFSMDRWMGEMESAAEDLRPLPRNSEPPPLEAWFLTGARFWYQTAFCAWTLAHHSGRDLVLHLIDDGTLEAPIEARLRRIFPEGTTLRARDSEEKIEALLPENDFPTLRRRCADYINIRKLVDPHLNSTGWKLILDSDMLFFETPTEILHWWDERRSEIEPCFMRDCEESYGYSRSLMTSLTGSPIPEELNVGICGLRSETIDWNELEHWCTELVEREGTSYFLEQALVAMIASRAPHRILPRESYITFPSSDEANAGAGVLQHYVADSKPDYFGTCWKIAAAS